MNINEYFYEHPFKLVGTVMFFVSIWYLYEVTWKHTKRMKHLKEIERKKKCKITTTDK
jgi:hypothetical protein